MELAAILLVPAVASALSLAPIGRRLAAPLTTAANAIVLALAVMAALEATRAGRTETLSGWLTLDGLGALVLVLVALVGSTAALFS